MDFNGIKSLLLLEVKVRSRGGVKVASSPVPLFSRAGRRAARFARGRKKKGLVSTVCACAGFSWNSMKQ